MAGEASARRLPALSRRGWVLVALVLICVVAGAVMRVQAIGSRYGAGEHADGDVYRYYVSVARSVLEGRGWVTDYEWNFIPPPGQAAFLLLVPGLVPGADFGDARAVQAAISILTIGLAFWIGFRMGGAAVGAAATVVLALDRNVIEYVGILLAENNYFFLLLLFLALLLEAARRRSPGWSCAAGAALALTSLTKPFPMLLALLLPVYLLLRHRDRRAVRDGALFLAAFLLLVSPWIVRNYVRYGELYPISTNAGTLLAQSNFLGFDPGDPDQVYWESIYRTDRWQDPGIEARFAGQVDRHGRPEWNRKDRAYMRHALRYAFGHPAQFLRNYAIKLVNALRYPAPALGEPWRPSDFYRAALLLLGLPGLAWFAVAERRRAAWVMVPIVVYFAGFTALMHIVRSGRINLPLKLLLGFFAAYLVVRIVSRDVRGSRPHRAS